MKSKLCTSTTFKMMSFPQKYLRKEKSSRILTRPALPIGLGTTAAFSALFWILAINSCLAVAEEVAAEEAEVIEGPPPPDSCLRRAPLPPATVGGGPWSYHQAWSQWTTLGAGFPSLLRLWWRGPGSQQSPHAERGYGAAELFYDPLLGPLELLRLLQVLGFPWDPWQPCDLGSSNFNDFQLVL